MIGIEINQNGGGLVVMIKNTISKESMTLEEGEIFVKVFEDVQLTVFLQSVFLSLLTIFTQKL
jgi:hypothetical protein